MGNEKDKPVKPSDNIYRLFITEYESTRDWTNGGKKSILSSIKEDDFYLIFKSGKGMIPAPTCIDIIEQMGEHKLIRECEELSDDDYRMLILQEIKRYANESTCVYFLSMESMYLELRERIDSVADIRSCRSFSTLGRKSIDSNKTKTSMSKPKRNKKEAPKRETSDNSDTFDALQKMQLEPDINISEPAYKETKTDEQKNDEQTDDLLRKKFQQCVDSDATEKIKTEDAVRREENSNKTSENRVLNMDKENKPHLDMDKNKETQAFSNFDTDDIKKVDDKKKAEMPPPRPTFGGNPKENRSSSEPHTERPYMGGDARNRTSNFGDGGTRPSPGGVRSPNPAQPGRSQQGPMGKGNPKGGKQSSQPQQTSDDYTLQEIEKMIFTSKQKEIVIEKTYSKTDVAKITLINSLTERFMETVGKLSKNVADYDFSYDQYVKLLSVLAKSVNFNDFSRSWEIQEPGKPLGITEPAYKMLYDVARHYANECKNLYEDDPLA